jgi:Flp pilus assembly protein TadD
MSTVEQYDEAIALKESGKLDDAVAKLEELTQSEPDYALAHTALSVFYQQLGRNDEAVAEAKKVCELEPDDPFSYMSMSLVCQKSGHIPEAEQALAQAMEKQFAARKG